MKKLLLTIAITFISTTWVFSQDEIYVQNLNGTTFEINKLIEAEKDQPVIFITWAKKWCWPCVKMLDKFNDEFIKLQKKHNLKIVALNLDSEYDRFEIKKFVNERNWNFDVYMDVNKEYITKTETTSAPLTILLNNNNTIQSLSGFTDGISTPETTADYFIEILSGLYSNIIYFDEDWKNTDKKSAVYIRYRDKINGKYNVTDRWITGEIQMQGTYKDFQCKEKIGEFKWYNKDGTLNSSETF